MERQSALATADKRLEQMSHPAEMAMKYSALRSNTQKSMDTKRQVKTSDHSSLLDTVVEWVGVIASVVAL